MAEGRSAEPESEASAHRRGRRLWEEVHTMCYSRCAQPQGCSGHSSYWIHVMLRWYMSQGKVRRSLPSAFEQA